MPYRTSDLCRVKAAECSPWSTVVSAKALQISQTGHGCIGCFYAKYRHFTLGLLHNLCVLGLLRLFPDSSSIHPEFIDVCLGRVATNKHWQQFWKPKVKEVRTFYTGAAAPHQMYPNTGGKTITTIAAHTA